MRRRLAPVGLLLSLAASCAGRPPEPLEPPRPPAPPAPPLERARARADAWQRAHPEVTFARREAGAFVVLSAEGDRAPLSGAVASASGVVEGIACVHVVDAERDVDGDGRPDLVVLRRPPASGADTRGAVLDLAVVADRASGPALLPSTGPTLGAWADAAWAGSRLVLTANVSGTVAATWNGSALVAEGAGPVFWLGCSLGGCELVSLAAGKRATTSVHGTGSLERGVGADDGYFARLAGPRGPRFFDATWSLLDAPASKEPVVLVEGPEGFARVDVRRIDAVDDGDGDGVPELQHGLGPFPLSSCLADRPCEPDTPLVFGLSVWNGAAFDPRDPRLAKPFAKRRAAVKAGYRPAKDVCPVEAVELFALTYLAERWAGKKEKAAAADADAVMKGLSLQPCADGSKYAAAWADVRKAILAELAGFTPR